MIVLSDRQRHILLQLTKEVTGVSMKEMENFNQTSRRTIYREFANLKLYLEQHHLKIANDESHYKLVGEGSDITSLRQELESYSSPILSSTARQNALACLLLLENEETTIGVLAEDLDVSEGTIHRDLKILEERFHSYQLNIYKKKGLGVGIAGDEAKRRLVLCNICLNEINEYEFFQYLENGQKTNDFFLKLIPQSILKKSLMAVKQQKSMDHSLETSAMIYVVYLLAVMLMRMDEHPVKIQTKLSPCMTKAICIVNSLNLNRTVSTQEIGFLAQQIDWIQQDIQYIPDDEYRISHKVRQLIQQVSLEFEWNFSQDQSLYDRLLHHMQRSLLIDDHLPNIKIELLSRIVEQYNHLYQIVNSALNQLFQGKMNEYERQLILLYFANAYENSETQGNFSALIICPNGIGASRILKERLSKQFKEIQQIDVADVNQLMTLDYSQYDVILSTMKLPHFDGDYLVVSPLLLDDELNKIKQMVQNHGKKDNQTSINDWQFTDLEQMTRLMKWVYQLVNQCQLYQVANDSNQMDVILAKMMMEISQSILDIDQCVFDLKKRMDLAPIGIPDSQIALLHAKTPGVTEAFVSLFELEEPIEMEAMDHERIRVKRFVLMLAPSDIEEEKQELLGTISTTLVMNNDNLQLFQSGAIERIKDVLSKSLMEHLILNERG